MGEEPDFEIVVRKSEGLFTPFRNKVKEENVDKFFITLMPLIGLLGCLNAILQGVSIVQTKSQVNVPIIGYWISTGCYLFWLTYSVWVKDGLVFFNYFTSLLTSVFVFIAYYAIAG